MLFMYSSDVVIWFHIVFICVESHKLTHYSFEKNINFWKFFFEIFKNFFCQISPNYAQKRWFSKVKKKFFFGKKIFFDLEIFFFFSILARFWAILGDFEGYFWAQNPENFKNVRDPLGHQKIRKFSKVAKIIRKCAKVP